MTGYTSYWMATAPGFTAAAGTPASSYDVAVVGAGFTGLTAARALAKAGSNVAVLEAGAVGDGASGRNGGHLSNGLAHSYAAAAGALGQAGAHDLYHAFDRSIDIIEAIISEESITCDFRRSGKLKLAVKPGHVEGLRANAKLIQAEADPEVRFLDRTELGSEIVSDLVHGGLLYPKSAMMHMGAYLHGLAHAVTRYGGQVFERQSVKAVQRQGDGWRIDLPGSAVRAKHLILAGGATGAHLSGHVGRQVLPIGSYIIATRPLTDAEIAATMPGRRTYVTSLNVGSYFRLTPDSRLIFGGRARFSTKADQNAAAKSVPILRRTL
ncbi:MAG: FAD-dependent oxidoreductase, partial [Pseudomonadota bacterium]